MKFEKASWLTEGDSVRLTMPLHKVDTERRIVSGFATLDNEDLHGDVVTKEASRRAFERFRGNIRLMHQPIPAGKLVNFREEEYYDSKTERFYSGIYVDAYISKGAENIWEMVLDGTLTGFSIGGNVVDSSTEFVKEAGKTVRFITDYEMIELSLVDNPANQLSNIFSIQKTADGQQEVEGMLAKVNVESVFYCKRGHEPVATISSNDNSDCIECGATMENIGWFESDGGDKAEKVEAIIKQFETDSTEGGENHMETEGVTEVETQDEEVSDVEVDEQAEAPVDEETDEEQADEPVVEEDSPIENPLTKALDELRENIKKALDETTEKQAAELRSATESFEKKLDDLAAKHDELSNKFGTLTEKFNGVQDKLSAVEKSGAFKKSADLGGDAEDSSLQKSKSKWAGTFLSMDGIR